MFSYMLSNFKVIHLNKICFIIKLDTNINSKKISKHKMWVKHISGM